MIRRGCSIANRGEIALRIIRACRELGIETRRGLLRRRRRRAARAGGRPRRPHRAAAGGRQLPQRRRRCSTRRGPPAPTPSIPATASCPNAPISPAPCEDAGLVFVGPPAAAIERMGSKIGARRLMESAGVPVVPGETPDDQGDDAAARRGRRIGFPLLIKPSAGGGGIGMKTVRGPRGLAGRARPGPPRGQAAFGDGTLYVERLIERPRHVEVQIFGDRHGTLVHLFERECSIQRRHQKVIEETPVPGADAGGARPHGRRRRRRRAGGRLPQRRHGRVPARGRRRRRALLLPRDEHAAAGRAPGHRVRRRRRPGARAAASWPAASRCPGGRKSCPSAGMPSSAGSTRRTRHAGSCRRPDRCCSTASRQAPASASMPASSKAARCRSTTIRCSPS